MTNQSIFLHSSTPTPPQDKSHSTSPHPETKPGPDLAGAEAQTEETTTAVVAVAAVVESRTMEAVDSAEERSAGLATLTMGRCISRLVVRDDLQSVPRSLVLIAEFMSLGYRSGGLYPIPCTYVAALTVVDGIFNGRYDGISLLVFSYLIFLYFLYSFEYRLLNIISFDIWYSITWRDQR